MVTGDGHSSGGGSVTGAGFRLGTIMLCGRGCYVFTLLGKGIWFSGFSQDMCDVCVCSYAAGYLV